MSESRVRDSISHRLSRVFRQVQRVHNKHLKSLRLSTVHGHILSSLWYFGPMTIGELQRVLALTSSTLTGAIDRMEKLDLVKRVAIPDDRRAWRIEPTSWAEEHRDEIMDSLLAGDHECFGMLNPAERDQLKALLSKVSEGLGNSHR